MGLYERFMHDWEWRLNRRDNNRVVRPLDWGVEWTRRWPGVNGASPAPEEAEAYIRDLNRLFLVESMKFYSYTTPTDFRLKGELLRFTSSVYTPYPENNQVAARWFPARGNRAVIVLPQWNCDVASHAALCRVFNVMGIAALRMSLPYHDLRKPAEIDRADYAVSANIGRTLDAGRQAVLDARSCLDWLEQQGYSRFGIVGSSLGSCYAFITSAHDDRLKVNIFNHASTRFADVVWTGQTTRHIRQGIDGKVDLEGLREALALIAPISYFDRFAAMEKKSLVVYASYDLTFPPELSLQIIRELRGRGADLDVKVLPCGHYSSGETPFKYLDAWYMARFLEQAF